MISLVGILNARGQGPRVTRVWPLLLISKQLFLSLAYLQFLAMQSSKCALVLSLNQSSQATCSDILMSFPWLPQHLIFEPLPLGPVSRSPENFLDPKSQLRPAYSVKVVFSYVVEGWKSKLL